MKLGKGVTDFLSVVGDLVIALLTALGQQVAQVVWAIRIVLYSLQAFFIVADRGRGKATNFHVRSTFFVPS